MVYIDMVSGHAKGSGISDVMAYTRACARCLTAGMQATFGVHVNLEHGEGFGNMEANGVRKKSA